MMNKPPPIGPPPSRPNPRPPKRSRNRIPVIVGAGVIIAIVAGVMWLSGGNNDQSPPPPHLDDTTSVTATTTAPSEPSATEPAISTPDEPTITVPGTTTNGPTKSPTSTPSTPATAPAPERSRPEDVAPNGRGKKGVIRAVPDRTKQRVPARPQVDMSQVAWPDAPAVSRNALDVAHAIASSDGRQPKKLAASVSKLVAPNVESRLVDMFGNGAAAPKGVKLQPQLLSANLQSDTQTGARYAIVIIRRTFDGNPTEAIVHLEFAPTQPIVTDFDYEPIVSG